MKPEQIAIEGDRALDVGHPEINMPELRAIGCFVIGHVLLQNLHTVLKDHPLPMLGEGTTNTRTCLSPELGEGLGVRAVIPQLSPGFPSYRWRYCVRQRREWPGI